MNSKIKIAFILIIIFIGLNIRPQKVNAQESISFQVFYDELSPYGTWIDNADYGYVWIPNVDPGFVPYATNGYWTLTDEGWAWISNYPWGWAPFHYGRWFTDPNYGPMWVPDNEWGPGWVTWRMSSDYYGWAPIGPGVNINDAYGNGYYEHHNHYTFVRGMYFGRRDIRNHYMHSSKRGAIMKSSTVINNPRVDKSRNVTYNTGPNINEIEKYRGKKINPIVVKETSKPGQSINKDQLIIYRPQFIKNNTSSQKTAPVKVVNLKEVKTSKQRKAETLPKKAKQPIKQTQQQPQRNVKPAKQQAIQPQRNVQPPRQQAIQPQRNVQPARQQAIQPQRNVQPARQQPIQPQRIVQPVRQQQSQPKPVQNIKEDRPAH